MKLILPLIAILALTACGETPSPQSTNDLADIGLNGTDVIRHNFTLTNQNVTVIPYSETIQWLKDNKHIHIDAIAAIDRSGHGATSGYIIVWSDTRTLEAK